MSRLLPGWIEARMPRMPPLWISARAYPLWLQQEAMKQGIRFRPLDVPLHVVPSGDDVERSMIAPWEMFEDSRTIEIIIRQGPAGSRGCAWWMAEERA